MQLDHRPDQPGLHLFEVLSGDNLLAAGTAVFGTNLDNTPWTDGGSLWFQGGAALHPEQGGISLGVSVSSDDPGAVRIEADDDFTVTWRQL